jgi:cytochrome c
MRYVLFAAGLAMISITVSASAAQPAQDEAATPDFYTTKVQPILQGHCYKCHGEGNHRGGLTMDTKNGLLQGGHHGPAIVPGDPAKSLLVTLIHQNGTGDFAPPMPPPPRPKLSDDDISTIERWIKAGAVMPPQP